MSKTIKNSLNSKPLANKQATKNSTSTKIISKPGPSTTRSISIAATKQSPKEEEKKLTISKISKTNSNVTTNRNITRNSEISKIRPLPQSNLTTNKTEKQKSQPLRAQHAPEIINNVNRIKTNFAPKPKPIMNSIHNVTVSSPPPRRKFEPEKPAESMVEALERAGGIEKISKETKIAQQRERPRTRTLNPEEIIILKGDPNQSKNIENCFGSTVKKKNDSPPSEISTDNFKLKEPVAFEINFPEKKVIEKSSKVVNKEIENSGIKDTDDYEDDFESYESDFETGSETEEIDSNSIKETEEDNDDDDIVEEEEDPDEDSEETQPPITVIHREKESERKLDSGNYDLRKKIPVTPHSNQPQQLDSLDTSSTANSEQLDSGIGCMKSTDSNIIQTVFGGKIDFTNSVNFSNRGKHLMKKIQLDTITYNLFDLKPINYEYFMKIYGNLNAIQSYTQTNENRLNSDTQTDNCLQRTMWTQHPPQYDSNISIENNIKNKNCCDECESEDEDDENNSGIDIENQPLQKSVRALNHFRRKKLQKQFVDIRKQQQIDFDHLNQFLNKSSLIIAAILNRNHKIEKLQTSLEIGFSNGYTNLNANFLNALRVVKIFSNLKFNLVLTIHESIDDIYNNDFLNLISVWNISEPENPIRLLSSWSEISRADICTESSDIIICGLRDGSVAMWDLRETYSYCSKLDGYLTHFAATHSIAPSLGEEEIKLTDLGAVVDVKSFRPEARAYNLKAYKQIQFVSLNDTGILTIWTLVETGKNNFATASNKHNSNKKFEFHSPWARIKLIQSAICDLRDYLEIKKIRLDSPFDKTRSYFENDIFSDEALRELQESQKDNKFGMQGIRFINLDTGSDLIYIATNRNFIICCSKTLKSERFRKIYIDESKFLFPTALRLHTTAEFLLVGLSNGSVMALNCNRNKSKNYNQNIDDNLADSDENKFNKSDNLEENEIELLIGKSCTIQNIIRNERKANEYDETSSYYDTRPRTAISEFYDKPINQYDFRIFDQQIILSGSVLRKNLVEKIEISNDGKKLYALADGDIRVYDFLLESEVNGSKGIKIKGICMINGNSEQQNFVMLTKDSTVQVHYTKK